MEKPYEERTQSEQLRLPRERIVQAIRDKLKEDNISIRTLAEDIGFLPPQVNRVLTGKNCSLDTLNTILNGLDLEIVIRKKKESENL